MNIMSIEATCSELCFKLDSEVNELTLYERVSTISKTPGRKLSVTKVEVSDGVAVIPRFDGKHDRLFSHWTAYAGDKLLGGVCYVTQIADEVPVNKEPYPQAPNINCLCRPWSPECHTDLGASQTQFDLNLTSLVTVRPKEDDIAYEWDGETFYFIREGVQEVDDFLLSEPEVLFTGVVVNNPGTGCTGAMPKDRMHPEDINAFMHPNYAWDSTCAYHSGFNLQTEDGLRIYCAFMDFIGNRYSRPDKKYGQIVGYVVSNEVTSQYIWGNIGDASVEEFCEYYTHAMRLTWLAVAKYWKSARVYASFDHFWESTFDPKFPTRFYPGRKMTDLFLEYSLRDGNFPWNIAHHPYPENLNYPDFWNDRTADFSFDTPRITYKNMEVLEAYLAQEEFLYEGKPRRIIFSEQSLNSRNGALEAYSEKQAAAGYILSYLKGRNMKTLDMMMHRLLDCPVEFGLNLGLYHYEEKEGQDWTDWHLQPGDEIPPWGQVRVADQSHFGREKPICDCVRAVDTPREAEFIEMARNFIGPELFDYLLNPPPITKTSKERESEIVTH